MTSSSGFVPNHGQLADDVVYETALAGGILQVLPSGWQLQLSPPLTSSLEPITLTMELVGASSPAAWESSLPLVTTVSDYRSPDSSRWRNDLPQYQQIQARTVYSQIDLQYTVTPSSTLKSSYLVAAGADPRLINWRYPNANSVQIANDGSLVIHVNATTTITESAPIAWQDLGEDRVFVPVAFRVEQDGTLGFEVGAYDPSQPLVLDPSLTINRVFGAGLRTVSNLARHPNGQYYLAGAGDSGAVLWRIGSDGQTPLASTLLGSLGTVARVAVTAGGMIVVGIGAYDSSDPQPVQIVRFATATSVPLIESGANGLITDLVAHPSSEQVWMTWRSLPSDNGFVSTITPSATTHTATTTALVAYTHLAVTSSGVLYGSFSRSTVTSGGLSNPWSAGVSRWTGTAWQIVYERVPSNPSPTGYERVASGSSTAWIGGPLAIDSSGTVWVAWHESVTNAADTTAVRLWVAAITPAGALPILRRLSDEVPINSAYSATFANSLTVFSTGQVLVGGVTNGLSSATRTLGVQRGFLITLHSNGTVLEQHELQGSSNYEQWIIDLIEAAGDGVVVGVRSVGSDTAGFLGSTTVFKPVLPSIPAYTTSYYQGLINPRYNRKQGCLARMRGEQGLVILTYGSPRGPENTIPPLDNQGNPTYGAGLLTPPDRDTPLPASIADIETSVQDYIKGYSDYQSCNRDFAGEIQIPAEPNLPIPQAKLMIGVGSSNSPLGGVVPRLNPSMTTNHARAWAQMVNRLRDYIRSNSYAGVQVAGAFDAEPAWWNVDVDGQPPYQQEDSLASRTPTYAWLDAFEDESEPGIFLYMFSSLDGAPRTTTTWLGNDGSLIPNTNLEQRYALLTSSTGKRKIIPQAYYLPYDKEWHQFRWFAKLKYRNVGFDGVMSQALSSGITRSDIANDRRFWPEYAVDYAQFDPTDARSAMENLPPDQAWLMFYDVLHRTLVNNYELPANFTLPSDFVLAPLDAGLEVSIASTAHCLPRANPEGDGLYWPPDPAENHFFRGACFPAGTVLPREMTIPSLMEGFQGAVQPSYNQHTRGELPWLTDIAWGIE